MRKPIHSKCLRAIPLKKTVQEWVSENKRRREVETLEAMRKIEALKEKINNTIPTKNLEENAN